MQLDVCRTLNLALSCKTGVLFNWASCYLKGSMDPQKYLTHPSGKRVTAAPRGALNPLHLGWSKQDLFRGWKDILERHQKAETKLLIPGDVARTVFAAYSVYSRGRL